MVRAARRSSEVGVHGACSNCDTGGGAEIARRQIEAEPRAVRSQAEPGNEVVATAENVQDLPDTGRVARGVARRAPLDETRGIRIGAHRGRLSVADLTLSERRGTTCIVVRAPFTGLVAVAVLGPALHAGFGGGRGTSAGPFTGLLAVRLEPIAANGRVAEAQPGSPVNGASGKRCAR